MSSILYLEKGDVMKENSLFFIFLTLCTLFLAACSLSYDPPDHNMSINKRASLVQPQADVTYEISNWGSSFNVNFTIKNSSPSLISDWSIEFDWDWTITSIWSARVVSHQGNHYVISNAGWNRDIPAGGSVSFGGSGSPGTPNAEPANIRVYEAGNGGETPQLPDPPLGELGLAYGTIQQDDFGFTGKLLAGNVNTSYVWNGSYFAVNSITFNTTSAITSITNPNGTVNFSQDGGLVTIDLGWQSLFPLTKELSLEIQGTKQGTDPIPYNFKAHYVRGEDIIYPPHLGLPPSWTKGKIDVKASDLIFDPSEYYSPQVNPVTDTFMMYNPPHPTQILICQVYSVPYPVNTVDNVRIYIPGRYMAMGVGLVYEFLKINPHYMVALGTKENFAAGVVPPGAGNTNNPVIIDEETWYWPIVEHPDGPYQQEKGNFDDCVKHFKDYFPPNANHDDYTSITVDPEDSNWISSAFSSGLSITITRETLNAVPVHYNEFMQQAADPWAEFAIITFAYNRGVGNFFAKKIFTTYRQQALTALDITESFDMGGFAAHVPTVRAIVDAMNKDTSDIYDAQISWSDIQIFFTKLRMFYQNGIPTDAEWNALIDDVRRAFDVLKQHWDGSTISFRYDFLTLLRVAKAHLPQPYNPRPTGEDWYYLIKNANP